MALSSSQQSDIIYFLGWPGSTLIANTTGYNKIVVNRLTNTNATMETQAIALVTRLKAIDTTLTAAISRTLAKKVGDIEVNTDEMPMLRMEKKKVIRELSNLLDIEVMGGGGVNVSVCV